MKLISRHIIVTCILILINFISSFAQNACFTLSTSRGCAPLTVTAHDCSGETNIAYLFGEGEYDIGNPDDYVTDSVYTFDTAGTYTIFQLVPPGGNPLDSLKIEVLASPDPLFELSLCADSSVFLSITDEQYEEFFVDFGDGTLDTLNKGDQVNHKYSSLGAVTVTITGNYVPGNCGATKSETVTLINGLPTPTLQSIVPDSNNHYSLSFTSQTNLLFRLYSSESDSSMFMNSDTLLGANSIDTFGVELTEGLTQSCFKISSYDLCNNEQLSSVNCLLIPNVESQIGFNSISWPNYEGLEFSEVELIKNGVGLSNFNNRNAQSIVDSNIICGLDYCYALITTLTGSRALTSKDSCVTGNADQIGDTLFINTSYNLSNEIIVNWNFPEVKFNDFQVYEVSRPNQITSTTDSFAIMSQGDCFETSFQDLCGNNSEPSNQSCPIRLNVSIQPLVANYATLEWTQYTGWINPVQNYEMEMFDKDYNLLKTISLGSITSYQDTIDYGFNQQIYRVRIKALESGGTGRISYSNLVETELENSFFIPNTFSPNEDGLNDTFLIRARFAKSIYVRIFDRWGNLVYESTELNEGWDGNYDSGKNAPEGIYSYYIEITDDQNNSRTRTSTLTLIR